MALLALGLVLTGPVVSAVAEPIGAGGTAATPWSVKGFEVVGFAVLLPSGRVEVNEAAHALTAVRKFRIGRGGYFPNG